MEVTHQTTGNSMSSSSSPEIGFYFVCAVLVIGIVGTAANALVLYAMVVSKQHKKQMLIFNQNLLDCVSCFFLSATHAAQLVNVCLDGTRGYWLCVVVYSEGSSWGPFMGSMINLAAITVERYLRVVHHAWVTKKLHNWMIYSIIVFSWIGGIVIAASVNNSITEVINGFCLARMFWKNPTARIAYGIWYFLSFYVFILLIFIFCYWRILMVIRHQASVMATYNASVQDTVQTQLKQTQISIIKTMLLVSVLFAITFTPGSVYTFLIYVAEVRRSFNVSYVVIFITFLYIVINPFIYATKFDPVRRILTRLIPCKQTTQAVENIQIN